MRRTLYGSIPFSVRFSFFENVLPLHDVRVRFENLSGPQGFDQSNLPEGREFHKKNLPWEAGI